MTFRFHIYKIEIYFFNFKNCKQTEVINWLKNALWRKNWNYPENYLGV